MENIRDEISSLMTILGNVEGACQSFYEAPTEEKGEEIVKKVEECEKKFLKMKEKIVIMVINIDKRISSEQEETEIEVIETENGLLIIKE
jgi:hypothetical protein